MTTVVLYTDNTLPEEFFALTRRWLRWAAGASPIVTVSQLPIPGWPSMALGDIGRSHLSLYRQILAGVEAATTETVALAEHDCLYHPLHFAWTPPARDTFYYNVNQWLLQWEGRRQGQFSYQRRHVLSGLVVDRDLCLTAVREKVWMIEHGWLLESQDATVAAPTADMMKASLPCEPGVLEDRTEYVAAINAFKDLGMKVRRHKAADFSTSFPNLDIRHAGNFSGTCEGADPTLTLPPWGTLQDIQAGPRHR